MRVPVVDLQQFACPTATPRGFQLVRPRHKGSKTSAATEQTGVGDPGAVVALSLALLVGTDPGEGRLVGAGCRESGSAPPCRPWRMAAAVAGLDQALGIGA